MVHDKNAFLIHITVHFLIMRFDKLSPGIRADKHRPLGAPVIMRNNHIRLQIIYGHFHKLITIFTDRIDQFVHSLRFQQKIHQHIFKSHQEMQTLKQACRKISHQNLALRSVLFRLFDIWLPQSRIGAFFYNIRNFQIILPFCDVRNYLVGFSYMRHSRNLSFRPENLRAKTVLCRRHTRMPVSSDVFQNRVHVQKRQSLILLHQSVRMSIRFYGLKKILFYR